MSFFKLIDDAVLGMPINYIYFCAIKIIEMKSFVPHTLSTKKLHGLLLGAVGPRPIAFASTIDQDGNPNLSPYSFFNVFSSNPPVMIFSPSRRVRNNTTKHTLENAEATGEVVVNIVNYAIVQQMSLSSTEYGDGVNEFEKSGLTMQASDEVQPFRVKESPVQFECKVIKINALGDQGGAGNLIFAEVVKIHVKDDIISDDLVIDQHKIDQVARMGGSWYSRAKEGMFEVPKPLSSLGIGVDALPDDIKNSTVLTGNDLGKLGNLDKFPDAHQQSEYAKKNPHLKGLKSVDLHKLAKKYLDENEPQEAALILTQNNK